MPGKQCTAVHPMARNGYLPPYPIIARSDSIFPSEKEFARAERSFPQRKADFAASEKEFARTERSFPQRKADFAASEKEFARTEEVFHNGKQILRHRKRNLPEQKEVFHNGKRILWHRKRNLPGRKEVFHNGKRILWHRKRNLPGRKTANTEGSRKKDESRRDDCSPGIEHQPRLYPILWADTTRQGPMGRYVEARREQKKLQLQTL